MGRRTAHPPANVRAKLQIGIEGSEAQLVHEIIEEKDVPYEER
jgi:hypothetical protein